MKTYELTPGGGLKNLALWDEDAANWLAKRDNMTLTSGHWEIINLMRTYYANYNISPILKLLKKQIRESLGAPKAEDSYLYNLFPNGVLMQGIRIAGLPVPLMDAEIERAPVEKLSPSKAVAAAKYYLGAIPFEGKQIAVEAKGNLSNLNEWSETLAVFMAKKEGIDLTPAHWEVINFLRNFYFKYGVTPMVRLLMKNMHDEHDQLKCSSEYLYKLFPGGPSRQGSRFAGLPEPQGCIDD